MTWNWDLTIQTLGVASAVYFALRRNQREHQKDREEEIKSLTRMETRLEVLYHWWEYKVERRSDVDIQRYEEAKAKKLKDQQEG